MKLREIYHRIPVFFLLLLFLTGRPAHSQSVLDREVNLSRSSGPINLLLKEIARKGKFSFTYTSQIQTQRMASVLNRNQTVRNHLADIFRFDSIRVVEQNDKILLIPLFKKVSVTSEIRLARGLVIDSKTYKPLPFSGIFLNNKSIGTITNASGRFEFKIPVSDFRDTLVISHIGYKIVSLPVASIDSGILVFRLIQEKIQIAPIVVKPLDPIYIITKAIEKIPENYDCKPAVYTGFFRETTKQDNKNVSLSEAIINVFKEPYNSFRGDQIKIFKGRKGTNTDEMEFVDFIVQGGLFNTLQLDIVKNLPSFLDADYFALYQYRVERTVMHFERLTYVISFQQQEGVKYPCYKGRLYIDVESLAIVGATFEMPETGMTYAAGIYIKKMPRHTGVKPISAEYNVFYRNYNRKWNLSNMRSEVLVRVRRKKDKKQDRFNSVFSSVSEFVITAKDTTNVVRFKTNEISRPRDILQQQIGETDYDFWGNENIIIPEEPIEKAVLRLGRRNNNLTDQEIKAIRIEEEKEEISTSPDDKSNDSNQE
ncbi:MAG TPA: carboxypeptidase-like regulatory domain-containing protein [Bacteroidales bacterium]|nr:carboxypeptidase-like regulatory domain-containing protein [Bacteroidales bacterium]